MEMSPNREILRYGISLILFDIGIRIGILVFVIIEIKRKFRTLSF